MDNRQKLLAAVVIVLLAGFILDRFIYSPWSDAMGAASKDIQRLKSENASAEEKRRQEPEVTAQWKSLKERLTAVKTEEASNRLASYVEQLIRKHGLNKSAMSPEPPAPLAGSTAFREHSLTLTFQCSWDAFVKLLLDLYTAEEFVRIQKLNVLSHYLLEKESCLDLTLRVSTVSASPTGSWK